MDELVEIVDLFEQYFEPTNIRVDRKQTNNKIIRFIDRSINVRLNLFWDDIFSFLFEDECDFQKLNVMLKHGTNIRDILYRISRKKLYSFAGQSRFTLWGSEISYDAGRVIQGFYKNSEKYGEFIIEINTSKNYYESAMKHFTYDFKIRDISISISQPSDVFKLIFFQNSIVADFDLSWERIITIKFVNLKKHERESILQQAIFLMNLLNDNLLIFGMNTQGIDQPE